jgi:cell division septation protein DedD
MEFKFSKGGDENVHAEPSGEKKNQSAILVLLLLLVGGFSYIYFFTGIIKPEDAPKPAEAPVAAKVVKMPLPPLEGVAGKVAAKSADVKKEVVQPVKAEPPKAQTAPVATAAPAAKTPVQPPTKTKEEPKKAESAKPAEKKPAVAVKKSEPAKAEVKKASADIATKSKSLPEKLEKPVKAAAGSTGSKITWSILVGTYVLEDALSTDMGRVRKAGFSPAVKPGAHKKSAMNRLFLSEFADRAAAQAALDKLKRHTSDAFILDHAGKHTVYAGSYLLDVRAASEMERLNAAGFPVSLKHAEIAIPSQNLTLGPFSDKKTADAALSKLKGAGVKATLSRQ